MDIHLISAFPSGAMHGLSNPHLIGSVDHRSVLLDENILGCLNKMKVGEVMMMSDGAGASEYCVWTPPLTPPIPISLAEIPLFLLGSGEEKSVRPYLWMRQTLFHN